MESSYSSLIQTEVEDDLYHFMALCPKLLYLRKFYLQVKWSQVSVGFQ